MSGRNIEIKARIGDPGLFIKKVLKLADSGAKILYHKDTFFTCPNGRLKLREFPSGKAELIFYQRDDQSGPKLSEYVRYESENPRRLFMALSRSYGISGHVDKKRTLIMIGQTRVHIDEVENLGNFMELEVVLEENQTVEYGEKIAAGIMRKLGINNEDLIKTSYLDMLRQ